MEIDQSFAYTPLATNPIYSKGVTVEITPTTWPAAPEGAPALEQSSFTFKFMRQGNNAYEDGYPIDAGTYDVTITRPADDYYAPFSQTITAVVTINKADRSLNGIDITVEQQDNGFTYVDLKFTGEIPDLDENARIQYTISSNSSALAEIDGTARVYSLSPNTSYTVVTVTVANDRNYNDANITLNGTYTTRSAPGDSWSGYCDTSWYNSTDTEFTLTTPQQLAGLAKLVNGGNYFYTKTVKLGNDIALSAHTWVPIGTSSNPFMGTFDGQGHTISGVYYSNSIGDEVGLFGGIKVSHPADQTCHRTLSRASDGGAGSKRRTAESEGTGRTIGYRLCTGGW